MPDQKDYWMKDNSIFVCDGEKFGVVPSGETIGLGPVSGANQKPPEPKKIVLQHPIKGIAPITHKVGVLQHHIGRPRKEGSVHRTTKWRREKQGVLL